MFPIHEETKKWGDTNKIRVVAKDLTSSTNEDAKDNFTMDNSTSLTLYVTKHQTSGRGRGANSWSDTDGGCFLSTWSFKLVQPPQPILPPLVGLAIFEALSETWPESHFALKAPNDIFIDGKKAGGILIENIQQGSALRCLIGFGLNVFDHPDVENITDLQSGLVNKDLSPERWHEFLSNLKWRLEQSIVDGVLLALSQKLCDDLLTALNKNPNLSKPYSKVLPDGGLKQGDQIIPWNTL